MLGTGRPRAVAALTSPLSTPPLPSGRSDLGSLSWTFGGHRPASRPPVRSVRAESFIGRADLSHRADRHRQWHGAMWNRNKRRAALKWTKHPNFYGVPRNRTLGFAIY